MLISRAGQWFLLGSVLLVTTGCSFFHDLKPHRLHRLNRVPDMMSGNGYNFSIPPEPIPEMIPATPTPEPTKTLIPTCTSNVCSE